MGADSGKLVRSAEVEISSQILNRTLPYQKRASKPCHTLKDCEQIMQKPRKYQIPDFVASMGVTQLSYEKWLRGRAGAHVRRDKKRGNITATNESYKMAIHRAVQCCGGNDHYTGEQLNWSLLRKYSNEESKAQGRHYKATLALLPSVDHVGDGLGDADFKICAWRTNDAKNDLSHDEFVALCRRVVAHFDRCGSH